MARRYDLHGDFAGSLRRILTLFKLEPAERTEPLLARLADCLRRRDCLRATSRARS